MTAVQGIVSAIDADRGAMQDLLAALVAIPTENPPATGYLPCVALIEETLRRLVFAYERIEIDAPADAPRAAMRASISRMVECAKIYALTAARMLGEA